MDWNAGETLTKTKTELLHIMILECIYNLEQTINSYYVKKATNNINCEPELNRIKGFLAELECRLMNPMKRTLEEFKIQIENIRKGNIDNILTIYYEYETFLYAKGLTKWDNIKQKTIKDPHDPEEYVKEEQRVRGF